MHFLNIILKLITYSSLSLELCNMEGTPFFHSFGVDAYFISNTGRSTLKVYFAPSEHLELSSLQRIRGM